MTRIVFTDLDGTLLDRETFSWEPARPALEWLTDHAVPWVVVTSKTRAEVEHWRRVLGNVHPFVVENGGAAFLPRHYFNERIPGAIRRDAYEVVEWGQPYADLVLSLAMAAHASGCRLRGFHKMTAPELAATSHLPLDLAVLAKRREYDEPFQLIDAERAAALEAAIGAEGLQYIRGGRFHHVCGYHDKAGAVRLLVRLFRQLYGEIVTIGLGDSFNDAPLLQIVDIPIIVRSGDACALRRRVPNAFVTDFEGPEGWNGAVLNVLRNRQLCTSCNSVNLRT
jgi:mannosyl-3-phosphoglycerate phosphatase